MKRIGLVILVLCTMLLVEANAASTDFYVSTDRAAYTGNVTYYSTLSDAQNKLNGIAYAVPQRDVSLYFASNSPQYGSDFAILMTSWFYTTDTTHGVDSGWGNPNNTNTGFIQLYNDGATTVTSKSGSFGGFNGTNYTTFSLNVAGENANSANSYARFWQAPGVGGASGLTAGTFLNYSLGVNFSGLEGAVNGNGWIESNNQPTGVAGNFNGLFWNNNSLDTAYNGYYDISLAFNMDNWAYGRNDLNAPGFYSSQIAAPVPIPGALVLFGSGLLGLVGIGRRRRKK